MNEWEFHCPDEDELEAEEIDKKVRTRRMWDAVQTFAPEYKVFPKAYEIIWWMNN